MFYISYLVGVGILLFIGMTFEWSLGAIVTANLLSFWDVPTLLFVLLCCVLALLCTKSFRAFGNAFLFIFGKKEMNRTEAEKALLSVHAVMGTSLLSGGLFGVMRLVNMLHQFADPSAIGIPIVLSLLAMGYALVICLVLLPLAVSLKQFLSTNDPAHAHFAVTVKPRAHHKPNNDR